jgi:hypothetical protein
VFDESYLHHRYPVELGRVQSPATNNPHCCRPPTSLGTRHRSWGAAEFDQQRLLGNPYRPRLNN